MLVLLACNCNISKRAEKRLRKKRENLQKSVKKSKKKPGRAGLPPCRGPVNRARVFFLRQGSLSRLGCQPLPDIFALSANHFA
jgi:hypothetical protein